MAATLVSSTLRTASQVSRGNNTPEYTAGYLVVVSEMVPMPQNAIILARSGGDHPVPNKGDSLSINFSGNSIIDESAFALDFSGRLLNPNSADASQWMIDVTWRAPEPGQDEQPGDLGVLPLDRNPEFWIEYVAEDVTVEDGYYAGADNVVDDKESQKLGFFTLDNGENRGVRLYRESDLIDDGETAERVMMTNSVGEKFPVRRTRYRTILVSAINVASEWTAAEFNESFAGKLNDANWKVGNTTYAKHTARVQRAVSGRPRYEQGQRYFRMEVRVEVSSSPLYEKFPNEGNRYFTGEGQNPFGPDSSVIESPYPLDMDGAIILNPNETKVPLLKWRVDEEADFNDDTFTFLRTQGG